MQNKKQIFATNLSPMDLLRLTMPYIKIGTTVITAKESYMFGVEFLTRFFNTVIPVPFKIKLRPLTSMTPDEALDLVKAAALEQYGDYRYNKWTATLDPKNDNNWKAYNVSRKTIEDVRLFVVDLIDGAITFYDDDGSISLTSINSAYFGWYHEHGFDVPTYPTGKTLKELNLAYYE